MSSVLISFLPSSRTCTRSLHSSAPTYALKRRRSGKVRSSGGGRSTDAFVQQQRILDFERERERGEDVPHAAIQANELAQEKQEESRREQLREMWKKRRDVDMKRRKGSWGRVNASAGGPVAPGKSWAAHPSASLSTGKPSSSLATATSSGRRWNASTIGASSRSNEKRWTGSTSTPLAKPQWLNAMSSKRMYSSAATTRSWTPHSSPYGNKPQPSARPKSKGKNPLPVIKEFYNSPSSKSKLTSTLSSNPDSSFFSSPHLMSGLRSSLLSIIGPQARPTEIQGLSLRHIVADPSFSASASTTLPVSSLPTSIDNSSLASASPHSNINAPAPTLDSTSGARQWRQYLLASETGSGKSIAYLLPMLQSLKLSELRQSQVAPQSHVLDARKAPREYQPRALVLAPTHELARQLASTAKALSHEIKLRVVCSSRANAPTRGKRERDTVNSKLSSLREKTMEVDGGAGIDSTTELHVLPTTGGKGRQVDVMVGTPMKLIEMVRGRGWDRDDSRSSALSTSSSSNPNNENSKEEKGDNGKRRVRRGRDIGSELGPGNGRWRGEAEMSLEDVEWVVVDEADVLFDPDFQSTTRLLLSEIAAAKGHDNGDAMSISSFDPRSDILGLGSSYPSYEPDGAEGVEQSSSSPSSPSLSFSPSSSTTSTSAQEFSHTNSNASSSSNNTLTPTAYPFNLLLTSATIPAALSRYLELHHPHMARLVSSGVHRLPKSLSTEYVDWSGGRKEGDVERRIRQVWAEDSVSFSRGIGIGGGGGNGELGGESPSSSSPSPSLSKILIFCNKSSKVDSLASYLESKGIRTVALTSVSEERARGSNRHLEGFVRSLKSSSSDPTTTPSHSTSSSASFSSSATATAKYANTASSSTKSEPSTSDPKLTPHVMITTSLLSRGLDFGPEIKHVFIIDEPRNMVDFLHRAGRTGRLGSSSSSVSGSVSGPYGAAVSTAGRGGIGREGEGGREEGRKATQTPTRTRTREEGSRSTGTVVIFGKGSGRGSGRVKEVREKVRALR